MAMVDIAATNEDNVLTNSELEELIQQDLKYRDKQLMRLKDEVLDLEDFNESVALNEFTLDDFRMDLSNYVEAGSHRGPVLAQKCRQFVQRPGRHAQWTRPRL